MDTVDVDVLEVESYKSPEPEEYVGSTHGPQFTDLFSVPTPPPAVTDQQPSLFSLDEPDKNKQNGQSSKPDDKQVDVNNVEPAKDNEQAGEILVTGAQQNISLVTANFGQNAPALVNNNKGEQDDEFNFDVTPITKPVTSPEKPQTLPLSNTVTINTQKDTSEVQTVSNTNASTVDTMRMESINFEMSSPSEEPKNTCIDLHIERQESSGSMPNNSEHVQATTGDGPNFTSLLNGGDSNAGKTEDDEFDFEVEAKPVVSKPVERNESQEKPARKDDVQKQEQKIPPIVENGLTPVAQQVDTEVALQPSLPPDPVVSADLSEAQDEWDAVQTITPEVQGVGSTTGKKSVGSSPVISYTEAHQHSIESDLQQYKSQIKTGIQRSGFKALKHALFGPPKLHRDLQPDRDNVFCLALYSFSNEDPVHVRMLQTIFKRLTGSKFDCPRFGSHWEQIGFQGNDPSTDLRGCGMLGLLQLLYMLTTPKYLSMARDIYKLSLHETQNFPFCVMGINITRIAIQSLREDCLNKDCNKSHGEGLMKVFNDFYTATYFRLYTIWKTQHKTIAHTGFVIKDVETAAKKNPGHLLHELDRHIKQQKQAASPASNTDDITTEPPINFSKFSDE